MMSDDDTERPVTAFAKRFAAEDRINPPEPPEPFDREGEMRLFVPGMSVLYYQDFAHKAFIYKLHVEGHGVIAERIFLWGARPADRLILDGVKEQWEWAVHAHANGDYVAAIAFTWRGLRLIFPDLPEDPIEEVPRD